MINYKDEQKKRTIIENDFIITTAVKGEAAQDSPEGFTITDNYDIMAQVQSEENRQGDYMDSLFEKQRKAQQNRKTTAPHSNLKFGAKGGNDGLLITNTDHFTVT